MQKPTNPGRGGACTRRRILALSVGTPKPRYNGPEQRIVVRTPGQSFRRSTTSSRLVSRSNLTTISDLRGNPIEGEPSFTLPSGELVETELDKWALRVHTYLAEWLARPFQADQEESPCRELVVLAGSSYVDTLRNRGVFFGQPTAIRTGRSTYKALPPRATVRFPFREQDLRGLFEQQTWLAERADELEVEAAPARPSELSAYGVGYERDRARWQVNQPRVSVDGTEQTQLASFEDVPEQFTASNEMQAELSTVLSGEREATDERNDV